MQDKGATPMGEFINKTMGKAKKTVGRATGNRRIEAKGMMQVAKGKVQAARRKTKRTLRTVKRNVRSNAKRPVRKATATTKPRRIVY